MSQPKVTVIERDTNLRSGGSTHGPNNIITVLHEPATYVAFEQCTGEEVWEGSKKNRWWVLIEVPLEHAVITGWVSAVRVQGGENGQRVSTLYQCEYEEFVAVCYGGTEEARYGRASQCRTDP
jgi:hypothetical protein